MLAAAGVVYADIGILHGAVRRGDVAGWHSERPARLSIPDSEIRAAFRLDGLQLCREFPSKAEGVCDPASPDRPSSGRRGCRAELSPCSRKGSVARQPRLLRLMRGCRPRQVGLCEDRDCNTDTSGRWNTNTNTIGPVRSAP